MTFLNLIRQKGNIIQLKVSLLSDDDDEVIMLNPTAPPDRRYGKRPAGKKPHRRKTGSKK